jgi:hypothetical protein
VSEVLRGSRGDRGRVSPGLDDARSQVRPYSRILDRGAIGSLGRLDGRSVQGRLVRHLEAELVAHIGGNPTIAQRLLIERIIKMRLQLDALDMKLMNGGWTAHDTRTYGGLANAYRLTIRMIDNMRSRKGKAPSLEEVIELHRKSS